MCIFDPKDYEEKEDGADEDEKKISYIFAVGWDRKIHIWADEKTELVETFKVLP